MRENRLPAEMGNLRYDMAFIPYTTFTVRQLGQTIHNTSR